MFIGNVELGAANAADLISGGKTAGTISTVFAAAGIFTSLIRCARKRTVKQ